jgi:hypothetical protein
MSAGSADVLIVGGSFFGYGHEITANIERRGRKVLWFDDRPSTDTLTKAILRLAPQLLASKTDEFVQNIIDRAREHRIRDVLVIKGESLEPAAIARLRRALPDATFTLYYWDSYRNMPKSSPQKVPLFDRAFTFDLLDSRRDSRLKYRPLFFLDGYAAGKTGDVHDIDLLFVGTAHGDRYPIVKKLSDGLPPNVHFEKVLYFPSRAIYRFRRVFDMRLWAARPDEFVFTPRSKAEMQALVARARAVVDIERPIQTGLTMRSVEAFGAQRKLVTTNRWIVETDLYNPDNVAVIDRDRPALPPSFLERPYTPIPDAVLQRYTLASWVDEVLEGRA